MFIAFEGPDNVGKSTTAQELSTDHHPFYNVTKSIHDFQTQLAKAEDVPDSVVTYDRIDWFSHMVYRLSLPDRDWNDDRPRTVFAMPDTHLVIKLHHPDLSNFMADEVVSTPIAEVNPMYGYFTGFLMDMNIVRNFALFKTISLVEVRNDPISGSYSQHLREFSSPVMGLESVSTRLVDTNEKLLELLRLDDSLRNN
jgi:hypothetical protein